MEMQSVSSWVGRLQRDTQAGNPLGGSWTRTSITPRQTYQSTVAIIHPVLNKAFKLLPFLSHWNPTSTVSEGIDRIGLGVVILFFYFQLEHAYLMRPCWSPNLPPGVCIHYLHVGFKEITYTEYTKFVNFYIFTTTAWEDLASGSTQILFLSKSSNTSLDFSCNGLSTKGSAFKILLK